MKLRIPRMTALFCLCLCFVLPACAATQAGNSTSSAAQSELKEADLALVQADIARDNAKKSDAIRLYKEALSRYTDLSRKYPGWQPAVIEFRTAYCGDQIEALMGDIEKQFAPTPAAPEAVLPREPEPIAISAIKQPTEDQAKVETKPPVPGAEEKTKVEPTLPEPRTESPEPAIAADNRTAEEVKRETLRLLRLGQWKEAQDLLYRRADIVRQDEGARLLLAVSQCQAGTHDESIRILTDILDKNATNAAAHVALGSAYIGVGSLGLARAEMERALSIDPNLSEAHYNLSEIFASQDPADIETARSHYKKALELGASADARLDELLK